MDEEMVEVQTGGDYLRKSAEQLQSAFGKDMQFALP
jgi:hypothetical protein